MNAQLNVLWADAPSLILRTPPTMLRTMRKAGNCCHLAQDPEDLLPLYGFSAEENQDLLDKAIQLDAKLAKVVLSRKKAPNMRNSTILPMGGLQKTGPRTALGCHF